LWEILAPPWVNYSFLYGGWVDFYGNKCQVLPSILDIISFSSYRSCIGNIKIYKKFQVTEKEAEIKQTAEINKMSNEQNDIQDQNFFSKIMINCVTTDIICILFCFMLWGYWDGAQGVRCQASAAPLSYLPWTLTRFI
jgi:hypothetical protein